MHRALGVVLVAVLASDIRAQAPELAAYGALGQRWRDDGRTFAGGALAIGLSSPASDHGVGIGIRFAVTGFPTRGPDPRIVCFDVGCEIPQETQLLSIMQATVVLIPYRTPDWEFEFGAGASQTDAPSRSASQTGLVLVSAFSGRIRERTRLQLGFERHLRPNSGDASREPSQLFRHVIRIGLVYGGARKQ